MADKKLFCENGNYSCSLCSKAYEGTCEKLKNMKESKRNIIDQVERGE